MNILISVSKLNTNLNNQFVKVRKLKSLRTQVPKVNKPKPAINIIKAANLYLVDSDPLLSKKVSSAKELCWGMVFWGVFFLDENIFKGSYILN